MRIKRGVIGVIEQHGRYLIVQRSHAVTFAGAWCFPGGHIEPGENASRAVCRELLEELRIEVRPLRRVGAVRIGDREYVLAIWHVEWIGGTLIPEPKEISAYQWATPNQIRAIADGLPSNESVLRLLGT